LTSTDRAVAARVVLVAERRLVGQAIAAALQARRLTPILFEWPRRGNKRQLHQGIDRAGARAGVVLCDLETPDLLHDVEILVARHPLRWLVLTDSAIGPRWGTVLEAGAIGVLPTTTSTAELADAVRETLAGRSPTPAELRSQAIADWHAIAEDERRLVGQMEQLTHREFEILGLLYDGHSVGWIAESSGVAESTVRSQVKSLRRKLNANSQLAAVATYRKALQVFPRRRR